MTAVKSGNHIVVTGSGNTLASITSDIADSSFIEKTSTNPDIYTLKGDVARYLYVNDTGILTIGDPNDYSKYEKLEFDQSVTQLNRLYVNAGGHLKMYGNTVIDFVTHATNRAYYTYIYGALTILGNDTYKPLLYNYRRIYLYEAQDNDTYQNDIWILDKVKFGAPDANGEYCLFFNGLGKVRNHSFTNIEWDSTFGGRNTAFLMYPLYSPYGANGFEKMTFENLKFTNIGSYGIYMSNASSQEYKNCTFTKSGSYKVYIIGTYFVDSSQTVGAYGYLSSEVYAQNFVYLNGCVFENQAYANPVIGAYGATILLKDCDFQNTSGNSITSQYQARILMWTGNVFSGGREVYSLTSDGAVQWVHALNLTITDRNGVPIEDAKVGIVQSQGKESFLFRTNSSGNLIAHFGINKALLTWKHQYGNNKTTNAEYWSDGSNGTYHTIKVFKVGYRPYEINYVMDDEISDTIILDKIDAHSFAF